MTAAHLVTGATGFVGSALVLELLDKSTVEIVALVRGSDAQTRLVSVLEEAAAAYHAPPHVREAIRTRCHAVSGDVTLPECGVTELPPFQYEELWHSAASLRFEDRFADEIYAINTEGTRRVLELAARAQVTGFNYISTAYVAGSRVGQILEAPEQCSDVNNHYERSKLQAE